MKKPIKPQEIRICLDGGFFSHNNGKISKPKAPEEFFGNNEKQKLMSVSLNHFFFLSMLDVLSKAGSDVCPADVVIELVEEEECIELKYNDYYNEYNRFYGGGFSSRNLNLPRMVPKLVISVINRRKPNPNYEKEMDDYNQKMVIYNRLLEEENKRYEEALKKYKQELVQYEISVSEKIIKCEQEKIEKLKEGLTL